MVINVSLHVKVTVTAPGRSGLPHDATTGGGSIPVESDDARCIPNSQRVWSCARWEMNLHTDYPPVGALLAFGRYKSQQTDNLYSQMHTAIPSATCPPYSAMTQMGGRSDGDCSGGARVRTRAPFAAAAQQLALRN